MKISRVFFQNIFRFLWNTGKFSEITIQAAAVIPSFNRSTIQESGLQAS